jgi:molybdenum cofactor biosynthesis enzyme MoaA
MTGTPSGTWCALPWTHLSTTVDGIWGRCCFDATNDYDHYYRQDDEPELTLSPDAVGCLTGSRFATANPGKAFGIAAAFNSPALRLTRLEMLAGQRPDACRYCYEREDRGLRSHRQASNRHLATLADLVALVNRTGPDGQLDATPVFLDLRFGNQCNLECIMCGFPISSRFGPKSKPPWTNSVIDPFRDDEQFWRDLEDLAPDLRYIYFAGGEPFLQPGHDRAIDLFVRTGAATHIELHYNSNLTVLPRAGLARLRQFRRTRIAASCDGVGAVFESIRVGAKWEVFVRNLREVRHHAEVSLDVTVQRDNVPHLRALVEFARSENLPIRLETFVDYPEELSARAIPADDLAGHLEAISELAGECRGMGEAEVADQLHGVMAYLTAR